MSHVLDAFALTAYFEKEPGYKAVQDLLTAAAAGNRRLLLSAVNWGEVYYITHRTYGADQAEQIARLIETFPIEIVPIDLEMAKQAALFKVSQRMSYADCFAAALAKLTKSVLITGDPEFKSVEKDIKILWLNG